MKCPECGFTESKVLKTLIHEQAELGVNFREFTKRHRKCDACGHKHYSYEVTEAVFRRMLIPQRRPLKTTVKLKTTHL